MNDKTQTIRRDIIRQTAFYRWLRGRPWAHQVRDLLRLTQLFNPLAALSLSRKLWNKPNHLVELSPPNIHHSVILRSCSSDSRVFYEVFGERIYDFRLPPNASYIVDAGANIGLASIFFANKFPEAKIIAVEPSGSNFSMLQKNIVSYPHVIAREAGIWYRKEPLRFINPDTDYWAFRVEPCREEEANFPCVTISSLVEEYELPRIDILKMDIEGSERELLLNEDPTWLDYVTLLIIELHSDLARERFGEIKGIMAKHGLLLIRGGENCFFRRDKEH